jgi:hypothetical protein
LRRGFEQKIDESVLLVAVGECALGPRMEPKEFSN